uniref:Uncharacterized protein n=2 Tax=Avena sativa TaxID=4498 RepID=A0ACD6A4H0_AVESA
MMLPPAKRLARRLTTIGDLGDDLLREILVRLPALPSLVRAALACRAFLRVVRCSPVSFRRRFRLLHPPPVLGFFITGERSSIPAFVPLRRRNDPDLAAAVRGGDFFLTRLPDHGQGDGYINTDVDTDDDTDDDTDGWVIHGCRDGYVLLFNGDAQQVAACYNPLSRTLDLFPQPPKDEISGDFFDELHIFSDEEKPNSFRVFGIYRGEVVRVTVFSSDSRRWQALAWPETPTPGSWPARLASEGSKFMYWRHFSRQYMTVLNSVTLQFSRMDLPPSLQTRGSGTKDHITTVTAGETKDGDHCIFEACGDTLSVWFWTSGDDGVGSWVMQEDFSFKLDDDVQDPWGDERYYAGKSLGTPDFVIAAAIHGFVYLHNNKDPCSFMSLCLETGELRKLILSDKRSKYQSLHPYIMAWPPLTNTKKMKEKPGKLAPQGLQMNGLLNH